MARTKVSREFSFYLYGNDESGVPAPCQNRFSFVLDVRLEIRPRSFLLWFLPDAEDKALLCKIRRTMKPADLGLRLDVSDVIPIKVVSHGLLNSVFPEECGRSGRSGRDRVAELGLLRKVLEVPANQVNLVVNTIVRSNAPAVTEDYFRFPDAGDDSELMIETKDALRTALKIFGIDPAEIPSLREHEILDFDISTIFNDLERAGVTPDGRHFFRNDKRRLYLHKVDRTRIEEYLGVDLIYNYLEEKRLVFVQYKCQKAKGSYFPASDRSHDSEVQKMASIPGLGDCYNNGCDDEGGIRLCRCAVFIKLCRREVCEVNTTPVGVYYPLCVWKVLVRKHSGLTVKTQPHINNQQFQELVRAGLIGSTADQSLKIQEHLFASSKGERLKLIFEEEVGK